MKKETVLVTGGSGFLGVHTLLQLLQLGYTVRTTVRSLTKKESVIHALQEGGITDISTLSFYEADLTSDKGWKEAISGCDYVLHVASPFPASDPEDEMELIIPARDGALRVLKAAEQAGVKRVVLTSSFAAVGYSPKPDGHIFTEKDWTNPEDTKQAYIKSKTIAEKVAWDFIHTVGCEMELTVINPVGIFGPTLGGISSASIDVVIKGILNGAIKESPSFTMGVVDVRDVADLHIKAMLATEATGERFIAATDEIVSFYDVAQLIKQERPSLSTSIVDMQPTPGQFYKGISNQKAVTVLQWQPRGTKEALLSSVDSL
ncbi:NAD-dependent epimerase/dehydratase family protein [Flavobacterium rakeshii]|uniref:NAD-dependent epimerase/dehydratase family protein n=1 Tax=Flavobacterium rakeshii TaxID=1038845 RepID=A0A6N8HG75_9FLAO|nr:aldehyde reductase [Flavobacterium rakeshii]MUV04698.1 NAD-dependent epimerase/dehydratase family protein [Flavobacterium rakeshii]